MSEAKKNEEVTEIKKGNVPATEEKKEVKAQSINNLLSSKKLGDRLIGILRMCAETERTKENTSKISNKISKAVKNLRDSKDDELNSLESVTEVKQLINENYSYLKDCVKDKDKKITKDIERIYELLLDFGKTEKFSDLPDEISFD